MLSALLLVAALQTAPSSEPAPAAPPAPAAAATQDADATSDAASAPSAPRPDAQPERLQPPPLQLAQWLQTERPLVVLGRVRAVSDVGLGVEVLRMQIEERLHDPHVVRDDELLVIAHAGHARREQRGLYCLTPFRTGSRWEIAERVLAGEADYDAKLELMRRAVGLFALPQNELRRAAAFELVARNLVARDAWRQRWALDELGWLAAAHPEVLVPARRQRLAELATRLDDGPLKAGVESVAAGPQNRRGP